MAGADSLDRGFHRADGDEVRGADAGNKQQRGEPMVRRAYGEIDGGEDRDCQEQPPVRGGSHHRVEHGRSGLVHPPQDLQVQRRRHEPTVSLPDSPSSNRPALQSLGAVPVIDKEMEVQMARLVKCAKLQRELPGLDYKPFPNELGQRIYDSISQEAWKLWLEHFKMIMNEYRLAGGSEQANQILFDQADKYFFGEGAALPPDYRPPPAKS